MVVSRSRVLRGLYLVLGMVSLALGIIGVFLPIMPTTVFVLLAAYFFARSSERIHTWIVEHPSFGPLVRDYQAGLGVPMYAKVWAVAGISFSFIASMVLFVDGLVGRIAMVATGAAIIWYVTSRPTRKPAS